MSNQWSWSSSPAPHFSQFQCMENQVFFWRHPTVWPLDTRDRNQWTQSWVRWLIWQCLHTILCCQLQFCLGTISRWPGGWPGYRLSTEDCWLYSEQMVQMAQALELHRCGCFGCQGIVFPTLQGINELTVLIWKTPTSIQSFTRKLELLIGWGQMRQNISWHTWRLPQLLLKGCSHIATQSNTHHPLTGRVYIWTSLSTSFSHPQPAGLRLQIIKSLWGAISSSNGRHGHICKDAS